MTLAIQTVEYSEQELVSRAQRGEEAAFEALVHRYDRQVLTMATSYTNDPDDAKDIYQEVFIRVYRALNGFQYRSEFSTWLYRIVTNVCLTHQSRSKARTFTSIDGEFDGHHQYLEDTPITPARPISPERAAQNEEIARHVDRALETLSPQQRLVFTLKHYQGYKLREIADMMGCTEGTVKKYLFTATERLRVRLQKIY